MWPTRNQVWSMTEPTCDLPLERNMHDWCSLHHHIFHNNNEILQFLLWRQYFSVCPLRYPAHILTHIFFRCQLMLCSGTKGFLQIIKSLKVWSYWTLLLNALLKLRKCIVLLCTARKMRNTCSQNSLKHNVWTPPNSGKQRKKSLSSSLLDSLVCSVYIGVLINNYITRLINN
jgi:hypothetical protein